MPAKAEDHAPVPSIMHMTQITRSRELHQPTRVFQRAAMPCPGFSLRANNGQPLPHRITFPTTQRHPAERAERYREDMKSYWEWAEVSRERRP